jgi:adenylylsulfate kinase
MRPACIWITGLPGSGKSALADALIERLHGSVLLRMDALRAVATPEPTYSDAERDVLYRSFVYMAARVAELGRDVVLDATGHCRRWRELARSMVPGFCEIYVTCPPNECARREARRTDRRGAPAGVYEKACAGAPVPGVNTPYEAPEAPDLVLDSAAMSVDQEASAVLAMLGRGEAAP